MADIKKTMSELKLESYENSKLNDDILYDYGEPDMDIEPPAK